ncbi:hypothetical protein [Staphylococcus aureus]|uniref:hypothetical protein n=1 Tax=Staphylococcus aureus TaxID=1280 RepID=UPI003F176894
MNIDPLKNVRGIIRDIIAKNEEIRRQALRPAIDAQQIANRFNRNLSSIKTDVIKPLESSLSFRRNLFSEEAKQAFKESFSFDDDTISQAHNVVVNLYIGFPRVTFGYEPFYAPSPISNPNSEVKRNNDNQPSVKRFQNNIPPLTKVAGAANGIVGGTALSNLISVFIDENNLLQNSLITVISLLISFFIFFINPTKN